MEELNNIIGGSIIVLLLSVVISVYISIRLYFAQMKLYKIDEKLKELSINIDKADTNIYEMMLEQKEQTQILKDISEKLNK